MVGVIERGVPIPASRRYGPNRALARRLYPGESFLSTYKDSHSAVMSLIGLRPMRFAVRKTDEGVRVWRV